jgi:effector-binding domain-containing protein
MRSTRITPDTWLWPGAVLAAAVVLGWCTAPAAAQVTSGYSQVQQSYKIALVETAERHTAVVRFEVPQAQVSASIAAGLGKVDAYLTQLGVQRLQPPLARFLSRGETVTMEVGYPVSEPIEAAGDVVPSHLPATKAAVTYHQGSYVAMPNCYEALAQWATRFGYTSQGDGWELYEVNPGTSRDPAQWRTQVFLVVSES